MLQDVNKINQIGGAFIVDIDGTVADGSHRLYLVNNDPKDHETFYSLVDKDKPIEPMINLVRSLMHARHPVVFSTTRPEMSDNGIDVRMLTEMWFKMNLYPHIDYKPILFMRPRYDRRPDFMVKADNLERIKAAGFNPHMALDDRERVLDMYRDLGLFVVRVGDKPAF